PWSGLNVERELLTLTDFPPWPEAASTPMDAVSGLRPADESGRRRLAIAPRARGYRFAWWRDRRGRASSGSHANRRRARADASQKNDGGHADSAAATTRPSTRSL